MAHLPRPGTHPFLPSLLAHVRSAAPALPLEPVIVQVLLLCIISGDRNLILRSRDEDVSLVSRLTALALSTVFGCHVHKLKCPSETPKQTPSEFLQSLFFSVSAIAPTDNTSNPNGASHKHRHRISSSRTSGGLNLPAASISTARSGRASSVSRSIPSESKPSITTLGRPQLDSEYADPKSAINTEAVSQRPSLRATGVQTDPSVLTLSSSVKTHLRHVSRRSTEALKLPSTVVVSGLELASLPAQKAVLRTLAERKIIVSDEGVFGHDQDGLTLELPDGFFMVYVCKSDPRERPPIYKSLLDRFAMSSSVNVSPQTRLAMRQYRPPTTPTSSAAFPTVHSFPGPSTPPPPTSPVISPALVHRLKDLCATQARIRPPLNIYLADLFSATRHYGPLEGMMLTVRARQDAEALICASRVLGADPTGAELVKERPERSSETDSTSTYAHPSTGNVYSDAFIDGSDILERYAPSSVHRSLAGQSEEPMELDVSEADIARIFPRIVSHRVRVRDSPADEVLSSAVCGAMSSTGDEETVEWERETVKDILVHILAEV